MTTLTTGETTRVRGVPINTLSQQARVKRYLPTAYAE
jgi:hypothetical protein